LFCIFLLSETGTNRRLWRCCTKGAGERAHNLELAWCSSRVEALEDLRHRQELDAQMQQHVNATKTVAQLRKGQGATGRKLLVQMPIQNMRATQVAGGKSCSAWSPGLEALVDVFDIWSETSTDRVVESGRSPNGLESAIRKVLNSPHDHITHSRTGDQQQSCCRAPKWSTKASEKSLRHEI
jgi:hypothetical protein